MTRTYLVQRGTFIDREGKQGIDSIISFDYMGSSEFEWGALPKSLRRIRDNKDSYALQELLIQSKVNPKKSYRIAVYAKVNDLQEVYDRIRDLAEDKIRCKEWHAFNHFINPSWHETKVNFWWDIENDFMWFPNYPTFVDKFIKQIGI